MGPRYRLLKGPSLAFRFARACLCRHVPGAWRLYRLFLHRYVRGTAAPFPLVDGTTLLLPLTWPGLITGRGLQAYEPEAIAAFAAAVMRLGADVTFIDCGADVGVFSRLVLAQVSNIRRLIAFEPNPDPFELLQQNVGTRPGISVEMHRSAVSAAQGISWLAIDPKEDHDHGAHLTTAAGAGLETRVETIDALVGSDPRPLAIKLDVEGEELNVLRGAAGSLARAPGFVVQLEAHPEVTSRSGVEPQQCLHLLHSLGASTFTAYCERTRQTVADIDPERCFFAQADVREIYDIVAVRAPA